jgi:transcriptional regulator with XRE-family HTH domain
MATSSETEAFARRLKQALEGCGVRASPTVVANEFNLRYWGRSITPHTARNWLLGKAFPTQDKLRVLADWLQVSPDVLRFGSTRVQAKTSMEVSFDRLEMADREMMDRFLGLTVSDRKTVREVVTALSLAATLKNSFDNGPRLERAESKPKRHQN